MSIAKVIEVIGESDESWEDAAASCVKQVSKTVNNIKSLYIKDQQAVVEDGKIVKYRCNANITFVVKNDD